MKWILHPIVTATEKEKLGIMAIGSGVQTVVVTANNR